MNHAATLQTTETTKPAKKALNIALWAAQILLAVGFGMAGAMKTFSPLAEIAKTIPWVTSDFMLLVRFIGVSELAGAIGLILPAATRIQPKLTALAGAGLTIVMALASIFHLSRGEVGALPTTLVLGGLAAFVAWGRYNKAPIAPRA